jgi:hypothetical protein
VNQSFAVPAITDRDLEIRRALEREWVNWPLDRARDEFLRVVARLAPGVLSDLESVCRRLARADQSLKKKPKPVRRPLNWNLLLVPWAKRWRLNQPWVLAVARNTITLWLSWPAATKRGWHLDYVEEGERVPTRSRRPRQPSEMLVRSEHFDWLVQALVLGKHDHEISGPGAPNRDSVNKANLALRRRLEL